MGIQEYVMQQGLYVYSSSSNLREAQSSSCSRRRSVVCLIEFADTGLLENSLLLFRGSKSKSL